MLTSQGLCTMLYSWAGETLSNHRDVSKCVVDNSAGCAG